MNCTWRALFRIREVLLILVPDILLSFIPNWLSYLTWYNLFFFPREKTQICCDLHWLSDSFGLVESA